MNVNTSVFKVSQCRNVSAAPQISARAYSNKLWYSTWPSSRSLAQPPDTLPQVLKAREAPVSTIGQNSVGVHEETRQSVKAEQQEESLLVQTMQLTLILLLPSILFSVNHQKPTSVREHHLVTF